MKRKLIAGAVVMALTLTTGIAAYAAAGPQENGHSIGGGYQKEISMSGKSSVSSFSLENVDINKLPDGVVYMDEISMTDEKASSLPLTELECIIDSNS